MIPGPANILCCPFCGGAKEVMSLVSGNTCGATVWSDTRRHYPMFPEVSPIQECPHCHKFYFFEQAKREYSKEPDSTMRSFNKLGTLTYHELVKAKDQMASLSLLPMQRWTLNHQLFMAYNDTFRRASEGNPAIPTEEDVEIYTATVAELLEGIDRSSDYELFHAELLRETGRFDEAKAVLASHASDNDHWVVEAILRHIDQSDTNPFLLIRDGCPVE